MRQPRIEWSEAELAWMKANATAPRRESYAAFIAIFDRHELSCENYRAQFTRQGWKAGPDGRRRWKGRSAIFSPEEIAWIKDSSHLSRPEVYEAFRAAFPRSAATKDQLLSFRKRNGVKTGRNCRFQKGQAPWSKGRKIGSHKNSARTQFKKGQTAPNAMPLGTERTRHDGYVEIKVDQPNPYTGAATRFVMKHIYLWEQANGPVPEGQALKSLDGDRSNTDPANWIAVPRALLPRLNGRRGRHYDTAPQELKPVIMAVAKLAHKAGKRRKAGTGS